MTQKFIDRDGLKILWNQISLKDYPNNETLMAVIDAIDETKANKDEIVQADWNCNDETASDYVKNRPFYSNLTITEILDVLKYDGEWIEEYGEVKWSPTNPDNMPVIDPVFVVGETYTLIVNGVEYECVAQNIDGMIYLCDDPAMTNYNMATIFMPAEMAGLDAYAGKLIAYVAVVKSNLAPVTEFRIVGMAGEIVKIDEIYLPDSVINGINTAQTTADNAQTTADNAIGKAETNASNLAIEITNRETADNLKMDKNNPVGTGSFSMNRKADTVIGDFSHAEGNETIASGDYSHAEGCGFISGIKITGEANSKTYTVNKEYENSIKVGDVLRYNNGYFVITSYNLSTLTITTDKTLDNTNALDNVYVNKLLGISFGKYSHAEGIHTIASGENSHAEGSVTIASGMDSHAEGYKIIATGEYQHVQGKYNINDVDENGNPLNTYAHIVGNGYFNLDTYKEVHSNAHTLDWQGNAWFAGDVYTGSTSGTNRDEGSKKLATIPTDEEMVELLMDTGIADPATNSAGAIYTDNNGNLYTL